MRKRNNFHKANGSKKPKAKREGAYNLPNEDDLAKLERDKIKHLSRLDEDGRLLKKPTKSALMSIIRGAIREKWSYCDQKMAYNLIHQVPDLDPNTRRRFKKQCEKCEKWFNKDETATDHIIGEHSLKSIEDFDSFVESIWTGVGFDDIQILCHPCHDLVTAMERYSLTEDDAVLFKKMTAWESANTIPQQKKWLVGKGFKLVDTSNEEKRRACYMEYLKSSDK